MLSVRSNMLAQNANRQLNVNTKRSAKTAEKLSSGYKINRAADDAAGLGISEKMRRQIRGLHQGTENIQDGIGYVQTADGALNESQEILQRINELSVKAANGTNTAEDRFYIDQEIQKLKAELARIFDTTTYNEIKIWEPRDRKILGYDKVQAVRFYGPNKEIDVTNANCDVLARSGYQIHANKEDGVWVSWTGYNGEPFETVPISWEKLKKNNYSFEMSDYFDEDDILWDINREPLFKQQISFSVQPTATIDDIIKCIDGVTYSSSYDAWMKGRFEDKNGNPVSRDVSVYADLYYSAAYDSNKNSGLTFDDGDDTFLEPRGKNNALVQGDNATADSNLTSCPSESTVEQARTNDAGWTFSFYMKGIGNITATSGRLTYYASDRTDDDEGLWWRHGTGIYYNEKYGIPHYASPTLSGVMDALTGGPDSDTPGLLNKNKNGYADRGGYIEIRFDLDADGYGSVGYFTLTVNVNTNDDEQSVLDKIQTALYEDTILDFYTESGSSTYASCYVRTPTAKTNVIDVPIYGGTCGFFVQAGPEAGEHIDIKYESLNLLSLGLRDTNALTVESAGRAINEVKNGLQIVSEQRSAFGAYQNRLEHALKINQNSEENTQAAESVIRDTDIAKTILEYANQNILLQAGTSILAQANQQPGFIMQLLQ